MRTTRCGPATRSSRCPWRTTLPSPSEHTDRRPMNSFIAKCRWPWRRLRTRGLMGLVRGSSMAACVIGALREDRRARVFAMEESSVRRRSYLAMKEFIGVPTLRTWIPLVRSDIIDFDAHAADLDSPCPQPTPGPSSLGDERIHRCVGMPRGLLTLSLHMPAAQLPRRGPPA